MIRIHTVLFASALAACSPSTPPDGEAPAPVAEPAASPDTVALDAGDAALAERPVAPVRVDGACPFEGCRYGAWTTSAPTTIYAAAADTASAAFTVPAGTRLDATDGFVLVTQVGVAVAERPSEVYVSPEDRRPVATGDTLRVLDHEGEGSYRVWADGTLGFSMDVMATGGVDVGRPFRIVAEPARQWWVRVETPDGRAGWLWMDRTPPVRGADAFAAP